MGLFSSSPSQQPPPSQSQPQPPTTPPASSSSSSPSSAYIAPDRTARARCWAARDDFFACLERHGIVDGIKEQERAESVCAVEGRGLERECAASWVTHFKQKRVMEHKKAQTLARLQEEDAKLLASMGGGNQR